MNNQKTYNNLPNFDLLMIPTIKALQELGGSGTIGEINEKASQLANLSEDVLKIPHNEDNGSQSEVDYRLAWSRTYLKKYGLIENSARGVWSLTNSNIDIDSMDKDKIVNFVRNQNSSPSIPKNKNNEIEEQATEDEEFSDDLLTILQNLSPNGFERICQRLLRESGFKKVSVTGKSGDGGIDGEGILEINPLMSFKVLFQAKRYQGTVGSSVVRDFRGAMQGRADKGIIITTGRFTQEAKKEAIRDGAPPIELVDGELLVDLFERNELGLKPKTIYEIDKDFFKDFM